MAKENRIKCPYIFSGRCTSDAGDAARWVFDGAVLCGPQYGYAKLMSCVSWQKQPDHEGLTKDQIVVLAQQQSRKG